MAFAATVAMPAHAGWLEELNPFAPTEVIPLAQGGTDDDAAHGMLPFTTFEREQRAITDGLPCKWISMGGGQGESRYDFLCKGGTWATVSLMMDKSALDGDGVGRVRLVFREWPETVHPGGGEAYVAQQFLQHVTAHFVPANLAKEVEAAFWYRRDRKWQIFRALDVSYTYENQDKFVLHRLEIRGRGKTIKLPGRISSQPAVTPTEAGLGTAEVPAVATKPIPAKPIAPLPPQPLPVLQKRDGEVKMQNDGVNTVPAGDIPAPPVDDANPKALKPATAAEVNTSPEPSSLEKPAAPSISSTLIPTAEERIIKRPKAPTNFDAYNKAEELTKEFEAKATNDRVPDKVKPAPPVTELPADAPVAMPATDAPTVPNHASDTPTASVQATPTPSMDAESAEPLETPKQAKDWPQGEGLGNPTTPAAPQPELTLPSVESDARFNPTRTLPQLKFIPKAVPLQRADEVIQFEDEGSGL